MKNYRRLTTRPTFRNWVIWLGYRDDRVGVIAREVNADWKAGCLAAWSPRGVFDHMTKEHGSDVDALNVAALWYSRECCTSYMDGGEHAGNCPEWLASLV